MDSVGLLLINLGTPDAPDTASVRRYLHQFLSDPRVLDIAPWKRWLLLHGIILRVRPSKSAHAYQQIWTQQGSPLLVHSRALVEKVQARFPAHVRVKLAMRYGNPSIPDVLAQFRAEGIDRIGVLPLYPQYSSSATGSSVEEVMRVASQQWNTPSLQFLPAFFDHPAFINAVATVAQPTFTKVGPFDATTHVLFSFHGLPERHCQKSDDTAQHCLKQPNCCDAIVSANRNCYRAQCVATANALATALKLARTQWTLSFQSRLGRDPWIQPDTEVVIPQLAQSGCKKLIVFSPAFVADCLETLEELGLRASAQFKSAGGDEFYLVPCVNAEDVWADAVVEMVKDYCKFVDLNP